MSVSSSSDEGGARGRSSSSSSSSSSSTSSEDDGPSFGEQLVRKKIATHKDPRTFQINDASKSKKRSNKNRPTEMSSKRQVSRFRQVLEVGSSAKRRDPRSTLLSGTYIVGHWDTAYSFLKDYKKDEIEKLKKRIKKCKKHEIHLKDQLVKQMNKLKNELVNKEKFDKRKQLEKNIRKREREQIASGKKPYFMKKSMLRREELKQKYDELEKKGQLNKYMSKRRKKNSSKDKKALPWVDVD